MTKYSNVSIIVAADKNNVIGIGNQLPWHIPDDLKWFKDNTLGKVIVMGQNTHESIGRILKNRINIVLSNNINYKSFDGVIIRSNLENILDEYSSEKEIMIIGGSTLYEAAFKYASKIYRTLIKHDFIGDKYFPSIDMNEWSIIYSTAPNNTTYDIEFQILERNGAWAIT
jgi:dihydrofolate reductase